MKYKRRLSIEIVLLLLATVFLTSSFVNYLGHEPAWLLLVGGGIAAFSAFARPKTWGLLLLFAALYVFTEGFGLELFAEYPLPLWGAFIAELYTWQSIYYFPGPLTTLVFSFTAVFLLVLVQLLLVSRGIRTAPLIVLGFFVYLGLWLQNYPRAEQELIVFLALSLTAFALFSLHTRLPQSKSGIASPHMGVLALGAISALLAGFAPYHAPLYYGEEAYLFIQKQLPELQGLQNALEAGIPLELHWAGGPRAASQVGYSPGGALGGSVVESKRPVMDIEVKEGTLPRSLYLRGHASDYYTGRSWQSSDFLQVEGLEADFQVSAAYDNKVKLQVHYLQPHRHLFGLFPTTGMQFTEAEHSAPGFKVDALNNMEVQGGLFQGSYQLSGNTIAAVDLHAEKQRPELKKDPMLELLPFLQLPDELPERVIELSHEMTSAATTDLEKAEEIKKHLQQFSYSTSTPAHPAEEDFVDLFLFELQEGYCAYFASAMTILLRAQNIPARYVEGFLVPAEQTPEESSEKEEPDRLQVKQKHAHAWVEAFLQGYGWVAFEPTPPYEFPGGERPGDAAPPDEEGDEEERFHEDEGEETGLPEEESEEAEEETGDEAEKEEDGPQEDPDDRDDSTADTPEAPQAEEPGNGPGEGPETDPGEAPSPEDEEEKGPLLPSMLWAFFVPGLFFFGAWFAVHGDLSRGKKPAEVYQKMIALKSVFHRPPALGETPGQIVAQLQEQFPELAAELESLKEHYQRSCYAAKRSGPQALSKELQSLPLQAARLYRKKVGRARFAWGFGHLFLQKVRMSLWLRKQGTAGVFFPVLRKTVRRVNFTGRKK